MTEETGATGGIVHRRAGEGVQRWYSGDTNTIMLTAEESGGSLGVTHASVPPGGGPPHHYHAEHDELFYLLDGELTFFEDGREVLAHRGDLVLVKRGTVHGFRNTGIHSASLLFLYTPGGPEGLFVEVGTEPVPGEAPRRGREQYLDDALRTTMRGYDNLVVGPQPEDR